MCPELVFASADLETWKHFTRWPTCGFHNRISNQGQPRKISNLGLLRDQGGEESLDVLLPAQGLLVVQGLRVQSCNKNLVEFLNEKIYEQLYSYSNISCSEIRAAKKMNEKI